MTLSTLSLTGMKYSLRFFLPLFNVSLQLFQLYRNSVTFPPPIVLSVLFFWQLFVSATLICSIYDESVECALSDRNCIFKNLILHSWLVMYIFLFITKLRIEEVCLPRYTVYVFHWKGCTLNWPRCVYPRRQLITTTALSTSSPWNTTENMIPF
jgi:hypothetical protein